MLRKVDIFNYASSGDNVMIAVPTMKFIQQLELLSVGEQRCVEDTEVEVVYLTCIL
jgi:hypothetical protein